MGFFRGFLLPAVFCLVASGGCSALAKRPATPAAQLSPRTAASITAPTGERYFLLIFGSQSKPKRPQFTHTWAAVVRTSGWHGPNPILCEVHTISWMPASLVIRPCSIRVEPGVNLDLHATIREMLRHKEQVAFWGPYEIGPGFYQRFLIQKGFIESGEIGYQCIDSLGEAAIFGNGSDCIHAITDMDPQFSRSRYPLTYFGQAASRHIVREIQTRPIIIGPENEHSWLPPLLGLDQYPLIQRHYPGATVANTPENLERFLRKTDRLH